MISPTPKTTDRQRALFTGLDCLAGQQNLFETDGPPAATDPDNHNHQPERNPKCTPRIAPKKTS